MPPESEPRTPARAGRALRLLLGAFGDPGHAFPIIALGCALRDRGHEVHVQTWKRWRADIAREGLGFAEAPEYDVFPTRGRALKPYEAAVRAARETVPLIERLRPHAIVADILTLAPALAGEVAGVPTATLVPHVHPSSADGFPPYSLGARMPRTAAGRGLWRALAKPVSNGLQQGRLELNGTRERLGLPLLERFHGGLSAQLCVVASFPQLEYPRRWARHEHVVGPLFWEPPTDDVPIPAGGTPLVVIAPSTSQDPEHRLLRSAIRGLDGLDVRVLGTWNRREPERPLPTASNATVLDWIPYSRTMPHADVVVCHGGHGTVVRALASGAAVVACPAAGDMNENAARVDWAGVGMRVPRALVSPVTVRLAVKRALADQLMRDRAKALARWSARHNGAARAAVLVERLARGEELRGWDSNPQP
ncbi:MAG: glycosyltransferase [Solirubrobacteraceae bacterium]